MKNVWYIARKELMQNIKDRNSIFLMLVMPLVLITVIGLAFGSLFGSGSNQITITVAVNNQDNGFVGKSIIQALNINTAQLKITVNSYSDPNQVKDQVANNNSVNAGVVIPAGTSDAVVAAAQPQGKAPKNLVQVYSRPSTSDASVTAIQNLVTTVLTADIAGSSAVGQVNSIC